MTYGNPTLNASGAKDETAYAAINRVDKQMKENADAQAEAYAKIAKLTKAFKSIADAVDFEIVDRVVLMDKKTGRIYR